MPSVLFVCSANQCRSPMAEALFKRQLAARSFSGAWRVDSAGVWAMAGVPATRNARKVMAERGVEIDGHQAKPVSRKLLAGFDLVLVMEERHRSFLRREFPSVASRVHLLAEVAGPSREIEDPVGGTLEAYRATAKEIEGILERGFERIRALVNAEDES